MIRGGELLARALVSVTLLLSGVAHGDPYHVDTAGQFLQRCRSDQAFCIYYVKGVVDGTVWTQIFDHHQTLCFSQAPSYLEIGQAYVSYLTATAANSNTDELSRQTLSDTNMLVLQDFLSARYGCAAAPK
jgi:hypothetical protein